MYIKYCSSDLLSEQSHDIDSFSFEQDLHDINIQYVQKVGKYLKNEIKMIFSKNHFMMWA